MPSSAPPFPSTPLVSNTASQDDIRLLQAALVAHGRGPVGEDGAFDKTTEQAVTRFQVRFSDPTGLPLAIDGIVGPLTWVALGFIDYAAF